MLTDAELHALNDAASAYVAMILASDLNRALDLVTEEIAAVHGAPHGFGDPTGARAVLALAMVIIELKGPMLVESRAALTKAIAAAPKGKLQ